MYVPGWGCEAACLKGAIEALPCLNEAMSNLAFPLLRGVFVLFGRGVLVRGFLGASGFAGLRPRGLWPRSWGFNFLRGLYL